MSKSSGFLPVDGASLYYELRGADGPFLLLVSAGMGSARAHEVTAARLAKRFRVLTYDRRGFARSRGKEPFEDDTHPSEIVSRNARDAAALIQHFSPNRNPIFVFASCFGATIVLQLLQSYPELVRLAVVHEPDLPLLISNESDKEEILSMNDTLPGSDGEVAAEAAMSVVLDEDNKKALQRSNDYDQLIAYSAQHMSHYYTHESKFARRHHVDWKLLHAQKHKLVLAVGIESRLPLQVEPVRCIAERLGLNLVDMPGAHFPFRSDRERTIGQLVSFFGQPPLGSAEKSLL